MVFGFDRSSYDAVFFVDQNKVSKQMLWTEFEAVLDGVVGEPEFAGVSCNAVYLKIDQQLNIVGAVFFVISFDSSGNADRRWNLPLAQMVETAAFGPQLNGKPIRVASRSQCQIPWHQQDLWEPDLSVGSNTLKMLAASVQANRLGLIVENNSAVEPPILSEEFVEQDDSSSHSASGLMRDQSFVIEAPDTEQDKIIEQQVNIEQERYKMAQNIKKQRHYIASLKTLHQQELESQRITFSKDKEMFVIENRKLHEQFENLESKYCETLIQAENLDATLNQQREEYQAHLSKVVDEHGVNHNALREQHRKEFQTKLIEQTSKIEAQLEMREVEVYYREEQINRLKAEIDQLKAHTVRLQSQSVASEISGLVERGVHFVISQPGIGPISIPPQDLLRFNDEPNLYLAERLAVTVEVYEAWIEHINTPLCVGDLRSGTVCNVSIEAVSTPQEFVIGVSDCCGTHQHGSLSAAGGS